RGKRPNSSNSKPQIARVIPKPIVRTAPKEQARDSDVSLSKWNSCLIIPKKKKAKETLKRNNNINSQPLPEKTKSVKTEEVLPSAAQPEADTKNSKEETLSYDNGLKQLEELDSEISKNKLEPAEEQSLQENQIKEEGSKRNSYM